VDLEPCPSKGRSQGSWEVLVDEKRGH
jgi:hypothetical protein